MGAEGDLLIGKGSRTKMYQKLKAEVTITKILVHQNLIKRTWKNKNYLVSNSELVLTLYAQDSRRKK